MKAAEGADSGRVVFGVVLVLLGVVFLLQQVFPISLGPYGWPLFIIVPGVLVFVASLRLPREPARALSPVGGMAVITGLILFLQSLFNIFHTWAYAWALVAPAGFGLSWIVYGLLVGDEKTRQEGRQMAGIGLIMFLIAAAFFELVIGLSGLALPWGGSLWPVLLILAGLVLLVRGAWRGRSS